MGGEEWKVVTVWGLPFLTCSGASPVLRCDYPSCTSAVYSHSCIHTVRSFNEYNISTIFNGDEKKNGKASEEYSQTWVVLFTRHRGFLGLRILGMCLSKISCAKTLPTVSLTMHQS
jgi:hypothetical protein